MRSSRSLSFVDSHVCVGVLSFVSARFMSTMVSCSRLPPGVRVLFPKLLCLLLKSPVSVTLSRPKQDPSMISLEDRHLGQHNVEMRSVPVVVCTVIANCSFEVAPLVGIGLTTSKLTPFLTSIATPPPCLFSLSALAMGWQPVKNSKNDLMLYIIRSRGGGGGGGQEKLQRISCIFFVRTFVVRTL